MLGKLAAFALMRKTTPAYGRLLPELLAGVGTMLCLGLTIAFLLNILIAGIIYFVFNILIESGVPAHTAIFGLGIFVIFLMLIVALIINHYVRKVKKISKKLIISDSPLGLSAGTIVNSFLDGVLGKPKE